MAQTSLIIGKGNWAVKSNSLLGYNILDDNRYTPIPIDATRATSGSRVNSNGVIETVAANVPRIDYTDGTSSLLLEPQRTNLVTYSSTFTDSSWFKQVTSAVLDPIIISPDGTANAYKISRGNISSGCYISNSTTSPSGSLFTATLYAKLGEVSTNIGLRVQSGYPNRGDALFNLSTGTFLGAQNGGTNTLTSGSIKSVGNGWYRCSVTTTFSSSITSPGIVCAPTALTSVTGFEAADGALSNCYVWGAQLETGSYATSYIPTTTSAVTRNQDLASVSSGSSLIGQTAGVLFVESAALANDLTAREISISDGTTSNRMTLYYNVPSNQVTVSMVSNGSTTLVGISYTLTNSTQFAKIAVRYSNTLGISLWVNGVNRASSIVTTLPISMNRFSFDRATSFAPFYSKVKSAQLYKTYLTDAEMASLTTL